MILHDCNCKNSSHELMISQFRDKILTTEAISGVFDEHFPYQVVEFTGHLLLETTLPHLSD